jgi:glycosyltransferase involved in cell wall biosynthesis
LSVVVPTCNRAERITDAIESAVDQTYGDLEVLVVDDASDDDT